MPRSATALAAPRAGGVRARTRALILDAAVRVFARKGAGAAAIHEITAEAGLANGTFYNYFRTREELIEATSVRLAEGLHAAIAVSRAAVDDPAERIAIGCRRFMHQTAADPVWGSAMMRVWHTTATPSARAAAPLLADLRAGRRAGRFRYANESAALDLVQGTVLAGMRRVLEGCAAAEHARAVAGMVLRGLGVVATDADAIVARPLPPLPSPAGGAASRGSSATRRRRH
jgi:AcrR family transcriptional regulator